MTLRGKHGRPDLLDRCLEKTTPVPLPFLGVQYVTILLSVLVSQLAQADNANFEAPPILFPLMSSGGSGRNTESFF